MDIHHPDPVKILIAEFLESKYEGVTFSAEIIDSMEAKVSPMIRKQTEELVSEYVGDFFSAKKPIRKPRKTKAKPAETPKPVETPKPAETPQAVEEPKLEEESSPLSLDPLTPPSSIL